MEIDGTSLLSSTFFEMKRKKEHDWGALTENIWIEWIGGNCPVQAEMVFDKHYAYFRARGFHWRVEVGREADGPVWRVIGQYGDESDPFKAGYMPHWFALLLIEKSYQEWKRSTC
jgi:hypothetical protein